MPVADVGVLAGFDKIDSGFGESDRVESDVVAISVGEWASFANAPTKKLVCFEEFPPGFEGFPPGL